MTKIQLISVLMVSSILSACYVVPAGNARVIASNNAPATQTTVGQSQTLQARLYPTNAEAQKLGSVNATVTIDQTEHGRFQAYIGGEAFTGDATRELRSRRGTANGSSGSGRYIECVYEMHSPTLGKGECKISTGATFTMHVSR